VSDIRCEGCDALLSRHAVENQWSMCGACRDAEALYDLRAKSQRLRDALSDINDEAVYRHNTKIATSYLWLMKITADALREGESD
jgi:hypothetical protein